MNAATQQALEIGIAQMLPIAKEAIEATTSPEAEGKYGYITMYRLLYATKIKSRGMFVCLVLALRQLNYNQEALNAAVSLTGE